MRYFEELSAEEIDKLGGQEKMHTLESIEDIQEDIFL